MTKLYRIHAWCPRCDKTADVVAPIMPNPRIACHSCLGEGFKLQGCGDEDRRGRADRAQAMTA